MWSKNRSYLKHVQRLFLLICFLSSLESIAQSNKEIKKLALVIGNANYDAGKLKNPVNDALLMAAAFDSLGFDVILDTNIKTQSDFLLTIREFGKRRKDYEVGFVYYAGHGIQVGSENFMLPTKVNLESEDDVDYFGVNVQKIVNILIKSTDQVNVLILDACRNNPFESQWNLSRSLTKGSGLAKMQAPMGSLIAFSTTAGNVAPDGSGDNSLYCRSLYNNMFKERLSLDQLFRNVRSEVLEASNGIQQTEESTQLTGTTFYLKESNYESVYREVDSLIYADDYTLALEVNQTILLESDKDYEALYNRGIIYARMEENQRAISAFEMLNKIYPQDVGPLWSHGLLCTELGEHEDAIRLFRDCLAIDSNDIDFYSMIARNYEKLEEYDDAIINLTEAITLEPDVDSLYSYRSEIFLLNGDTTMAINDLDTAIKRNPQNWSLYNNKADILDYLGPDETLIAIDIFTFVIENCKETYSFKRALNNRANLYEEMGDIKTAISDQTLLIDNYKDSADKDLALTYVNRGLLYEQNQDYDKALLDYKTSVLTDPEYLRGYESIISLNLEMGDTLAALSTYDFLLDVDRNARYLSDKADLYYNLSKYELAIEFYESSLALYDSNYDYTYWWNQLQLASSYRIIDLNEKALSILNSSLENPDIIPDRILQDFYSYRGLFSQVDGESKQAEADYIKAYSIIASPENAIKLTELYWAEHDTINVYRSSSLALSKAQNATDSLLLLYRLCAIESNWNKYISADYTSSLIVKIDPSSENLSHAGYIAMTLNDNVRALSLLDQSIKIDSSNTSPLFYRSKLHEVMGESELAISDLRKTIEIDPKDPEGYYYSAVYYEQQNNFFKSLRNLDIAINKYVGNYYITDKNGTKIIELAEVYVKRAGLYEVLGDHELMCEDLTKARELGWAIPEDKCLN